MSTTVDGRLLSSAARTWLLALARSTIDRALDDGALHLPDPHDGPEEVEGLGAAFVTLRCDGELLGCIGSMEARRSLADDVAAHAYDAAFRDRRLPEVTRADWERMEIEVSVLGPLEVLDVNDRASLRAVVRPGIDGLLLTSRDGRGTFLPSVWEQVRSADEFLDLLWRKAGLRPRRWPADLVVERYQVIEFSDHGIHQDG